jgi:hypothetical protein
VGGGWGVNSVNWSIHCQKSTLRYVNTTTNDLLWAGLDATFNSNEQRLIGEGDDEGCRGESAALVDER